MTDIRQLTDWEIYRRERERRRGKDSSFVDEAKLASDLKSRVKGQDHVIDHLAGWLSLQWAREIRKKPIASVMFLGPTGTGKTELAKALAHSLFGDEKQMLRFDCSEFTGPEAKNHLIGVPTGYAGSDTGGKLTRPMLANPKLSFSMRSRRPIPA